MPSQEFYSILEMIIYPDVIEPEILREDMNRHCDSANASSCIVNLPFRDINSSN